MDIDQLLRGAIERGIIRPYDYPGVTAVIFADTMRDVVTCTYVDQETMSRSETPEVLLGRIWQRHISAVSKYEADKIDQERS